MNQTNSDFLQGESVSLRRRVNLQVSYHAGATPGLVFLHGWTRQSIQLAIAIRIFSEPGKRSINLRFGGTRAV